MTKFTTLRNAVTELTCAYFERRMVFGYSSFTELQECNDDILNAAWEMLEKHYADSEIYNIVNRCIDRALKA